MELLKDQFLLRPDIHFLNFGSFGATPKPIFEKYQAWQRVLEAEPVQFIAFDGYQYLADSRAALAKFLNCADKDDLVYVTNPSFAINMIAKSFPLEAGDEILTTDIEYGACDRTWNYYCNKKHATYRRQKITLPITTKAQFIEDFFKGCNEKTKAIFISHITSATGLILPAEEICAIAKAKGLITIVDGAHAPAHIPLDLSSIQADFYTGACHKWMMAPKGCSFLYAAKSVQHICDPMIVSWGYQAAKPSHSNFLDYHQMIGTRDFSAFLTVDTCIEFMEQHNWKVVGKKCHEMVLENAPRFFDLFNSKPICPLNREWIGQMISIPIQSPDPEKLQRTLFLDYKIEVPVMRQGDDVYLRYSINAFNTVENLDALYNAIKEIQKQGILLK
jgi:isopenicillin-N epimerase